MHDAERLDKVEWRAQRVEAGAAVTGASSSVERKSERGKVTCIARSGNGEVEKY